MNQANHEAEFSSCYVWRKKHRGHLEIAASMLEAVKDDGATVYYIWKHVGSSFAETKKYLEALTEIGFIETDIEEGQVLYIATEKGLEFLRQYDVLLGMMSNTSVC